MSGAPVQQREALADDGISRAGEPAARLIRKARNESPECIDEERFRNLRQHHVAARTIGSRLFEQVQNRLLEPLPGSIASDVDLQDRRQAVENWTREQWIERQVSA